MVRPKGRQGTRFTMYIPDDTAKKLKSLSEKTNTPQSHFVLEGLQLLLDKHAATLNPKAGKSRK